MSSEDRRDIREPERVGIVVSGKDLEGHPFEEQTESIDISAVGYWGHHCQYHRPLSPFKRERDDIRPGGSISRESQNPGYI